MESIPAGKVGSTEALVKENARGCCGSSRGVSAKQTKDRRKQLSRTGCLSVLGGIAHRSTESRTHFHTQEPASCLRVRAEDAHPSRRCSWFLGEHLGRS